jgi:ATP-dependent Clp protease protease subunit
MTKLAKTNHAPHSSAAHAAARSRCVPLRGKITRHLATCCIARILFLAAEDKRQPILIEINSPGGLAVETLPIFSTLNGIQCPVSVFCRGEVGGTSAVIAAHGLRGFRVSSPTARFSFKSLAAEGNGSSTNAQFLKVLAEMLARDTGKRESEVMAWMTEGVEFTPEQAVQNGLVDAIGTDPIFPEVVQTAAV